MCFETTLAIKLIHAMDIIDEPSGIPNAQGTQLNLPFLLLNGEKMVHTGNSVDGVLVLTNYRLFLQLCENHHHVPLGLIEVVEHRDLFYLHIGCKDARTYRCTFDNNEVCLNWLGWLMKASAPPEQLEHLFAFFYFASTRKKGSESTTNRTDITYDESTFRSEVDRLKFDLHGAWRISSVNKNYKLCPSYPPQLLVPACITDDTLETVAKFRSSRRIPTVVWRHVDNGAIIARCSQPEVGWLGWRSAEDEDLLKAISDACTFDRGPKTMLDNTSHSPTSLNSDDSTQTQPETGGSIQEKKKVLIMDARSYTTAVANRARGGGCECPEYYPNCEIQFMNLANIHSIRKSFHALRQLCTLTADQPNWYSLLEGTRWLQHMSGLMKAAVTLVNAVEDEARPVLVHCSDGWDRTPQIVALAEILLDPYYRTVDGFWILIEREWLAFGHKFADRCGHATGRDDQNERCPVFLQWLDCVHQLLVQFPCAFEFSQMYLVKLAHHVYSNLFGTFLCNTKKERVESVLDNTFSVWPFLDSPCFRNHLYAPPNSSSGRKVLWPKINVRDLRLWSEVYLGSLETQRVSESGPNSSHSGPPGSTLNHMTKTRSYGDLMCAADLCQDVIRRKSDPNIVVDLLKLNMLMEMPPTGSSSSDGCGDDMGEEDFLGASINNGTGTVDSNCNNDCRYKNETVTVQGLSDDSVDLLDASKMDPDVVRTMATNGNDVDVDFRINYESKNRYCHRLRRQHRGESNGNDNIDDENGFLGSDEDENVICLTKTETNLVRAAARDALGFESICLYEGGGGETTFPSSDVTSDVNHNRSDEQSFGIGGASGRGTDDADSDTECTEPSESRSDKTILCDTGTGTNAIVTTDLIETSTETLTSSEHNARCTPSKKTTEKTIHDVSNGNVDYCKVCAQNIKFIHGKHSHNSQSTSGKSSRYSTPPVYSRTPSANGWDATVAFATPVGTGMQFVTGPSQCPTGTRTYSCKLGDDGLVPLHSDVQDRLRQIMEEHRRKEEALQRELHTYRQALIKQVCHKCSHYEGEKQDDSSDSSSESSNSCGNNIAKSSVVESVCSVGEDQASGVESLRSDLSWEAVEDRPSMLDSSPTQTTLWVPDHAVSRCTGCQTQFWLGRRKHHCRNCGRIFCADCSENRTPLPSEELYNPVRVCTTCYSKLRRDCGEIPSICKHTTDHGHQTTNASQQITASSN
ncbi:myotubularin-related protein 4 isoform X3 [Agrilus planipennis]|uniref:Lateral signaling target protein 2 homolog n=1 Tax=Agrilus planipennis TaxID=224129 RepID=A0A1W4WTM4_AGRPL|nr:myotubularin-related protein 4 isoform X3 [Agrilus planipennis]